MDQIRNEEVHMRSDVVSDDWSSSARIVTLVWAVWREWMRNDWEEET